MVTGVGWTPSNELFSVSDDHSILRWGMDGDSPSDGGSSKLLDGLDVFVTEMKWLSSVRGGNVTAEVFVLGCSDGSFRLYNNMGRLDKTEKAHKSVHIHMHSDTHAHMYARCARMHHTPLPCLSSSLISF